MTLQLHEKSLTPYIELKFQLGLADPRWNFKLGWKFEIFLVIEIVSNPEWKLIQRAPEIEMVTSQARFKLTDDKVRLYESVRKSQNRYI